jgi:hypothetical protein
MDLHRYLEEIAGPDAAVTASQVDQDISRGRHALHRRRVVRAAAGSALAAAALAAIISVSALTGGAASSGPVARGRPGTATSTGTIRLVAYTGEQPKGFTIDRVPDGWFIQADDNYTLAIAPDSARNPGPGADPSKAPVYDPRNATGKIAISLESKDAHGPQGGTDIKVGDLDGVLIKYVRGTDTLPGGKEVPEPERADGDYGATVWVKEPSGIHLVVQFWEGLGFSEQQMTELTAGVHVHKDAQQGVG